METIATIIRHLSNYRTVLLAFVKVLFYNRSIENAAISASSEKAIRSSIKSQALSARAAIADRSLSMEMCFIAVFQCASLGGSKWNNLLVFRLDSCNASTPALVVPPSRLSTVGDRAFPVAAARVWNSLPDFVTASTSLRMFKRHL